MGADFWKCNLLLLRMDDMNKYKNQYTDIDIEILSKWISKIRKSKVSIIIRVWFDQEEIAKDNSDYISVTGKALNEIIQEANRYYDGTDDGSAEVIIMLGSTKYPMYHIDSMSSGVLIETLQYAKDCTLR